jgi:hypothetical protein
MSIVSSPNGARGSSVWPMRVAIIVAASILTVVSSLDPAPAETDDLLPPAEYEKLFRELRDNVEILKASEPDLDRIERDRKQLDSEIDIFDHTPCRYQRNPQTECAWYYAKREALAKRKADILNRYQKWYNDAKRVKDRIELLERRLNPPPVLGCAKEFTARVRYCATLGKEPAYACLKEAWDNGHCGGGGGNAVQIPAVGKPSIALVVFPGLSEGELAQLRNIPNGQRLLKKASDLLDQQDSLQKSIDNIRLSPNAVSRQSELIENIKQLDQVNTELNGLQAQAKEILRAR